MVGFIGCECSQRMGGVGILCIKTWFDLTGIKTNKARGFRRANDKTKLCGFH